MFTSPLFASKLSSFFLRPWQWSRSVWVTSLVVHCITFCKDAMTGKTSFWENPHNQETTRLLVLFFFITFSITEQIVSLYSTLLVSMWVICWMSLQGLTPCSKFWPGQMYFLYKFTKHIKTWPLTNVFVRETSLKNRVSTNYIVNVKITSSTLRASELDKTRTTTIQ